MDSFLPARFKLVPTTRGNIMVRGKCGKWRLRVRFPLCSWRMPKDGSDDSALIRAALSLEPGHVSYALLYGACSNRGKVLTLPGEIDWEDASVKILHALAEAVRAFAIKGHGKCLRLHRLHVLRKLMREHDYGEQEVVDVWRETQVWKVQNG